MAGFSRVFGRCGEVLLGKQNCHCSNGGDGRVGLLQLVWTIAVLLDHPTDAPNLPFDAKQPLYKGGALLVRAVQKELSVPELGFHRSEYPSPVCERGT